MSIYRAPQVSSLPQKAKRRRYVPSAVRGVLKAKPSVCAVVCCFETLHQVRSLIPERIQEGREAEGGVGDKKDEAIKTIDDTTAHGQLVLREAINHCFE